jgi:polyisoprenyl-teichoic acid--peptidoglycan teichoic acid transferase
VRRWTSLALAALAAWTCLATALTPARSPEAAAAPLLEVGRAHGATYLPGLKRGRPVFILVLGSDARRGEQIERARSDSIHLIGINPRRKEATILGFPRDSWVPIPGRGSSRINTAMVIGGPELTVATVESLTGIQIDYYVLTSFGGLRQMIDAVGGVEVDIPYAMSDSASGAVFEAGPKRLSGSEALAFSRNRKDTPSGDFSRSENQGRLLLACLTQFREEFSERPARLLTWMGAGLRNFQTDVPLPELLTLAFTASEIADTSVNNLVVPGGVGSAGAASVVYISSVAQEIYADMRGDGIVGDP